MRDNTYMLARQFARILIIVIVVSSTTPFTSLAATAPATVTPQAGTTQSPGKQLGPEFMQWCQNFMNQYGAGNGRCALACSTKNSGAQVCGPVSSQFGAQGCHSNNRTAIFSTHAQGIGAHAALLRNYCSKQGRCTLQAVTSKWAPASHVNPSAPGFRNQPSAYADTVAKWLQMSPSQVFDPNNIDQMAKIVVGMARLEGGSVQYSCQDAVQGVHMAFGLTPVVAGPNNIGALVEGNPAAAQLFSGLYTQNQGFGDPFNQNGTNPFNSSNSAFSPTSSSGTQQQPAQQNPYQYPPYQQSYQQPPQPAAFTPDVTTTTDTPTDVTISDAAIAEIACKPNSVAWVCNEGSVSRGIAKPTDSLFATKGALIGSLYVNPKEKTTYTIQCLKNQKIIDSASCSLMPHKRVVPPSQTRKPQVTFDADPIQVRRGERTTLTWAVLKVDSCTVSGEGVSADGTEGSVETDRLTEVGKSPFTLECQDSNGETLLRTVTIEVL